MNHVHPDDELLSAALDGDADPATIAHFGECDDCLSRLDALDRVRQQVAAVPAPAPAGAADRAVAAATAAWRDERGRAAATAPAAPPRRAGAARGNDQRVDDDIVPLRRRPPAPAPGRSSGRRVPGWALGAAAAVVAVLLAVPFLVDGGGTGEQTASAPTEGAADQAFSLDAGAVDGGELGSLSDEGTLREELLRSVPGAAALAQARNEAAAPSSGDSAPAPAAAPTLAAGTSTSAAGQAADANEERTTAGGADGDVPCRGEIRAEVGDRLGPLLYTAALRWQDTDAVVLAYRLADTSGPGADHLAFVMARDDCRVLTSQGF